MKIVDYLQMLSDSTLARIVGGDDSSGGAYLFPAIETVHVLALATVFGSIFMLDLRLLGVNARGTPVSKLSNEVLPWTWAAFLLAALSGSLMFISKAPTYWANLQFEVKFAAIFLAGVNMVVFHFGVFRRVNEWDLSLPTPLAARVAAALSLGLWIAVIVMGRWVGFTT